MNIQNIGNLSQNETTTKTQQSNLPPVMEEKQHSQFVSSQASQASRAYASAGISKSKNVNFEGKYEKITQLIKDATSSSKVHMGFDEVRHFLERLGYKMEQGKGSHYTVNVPNSRPLTIVKPHGGHKYVDPGTIKDLRSLLAN